MGASCLDSVNVISDVKSFINLFIFPDCVRENRKTDCTHTDEERSFNGTFTTVELKKALSLGYTVTEVYHVRYNTNLNKSKT